MSIICVGDELVDIDRTPGPGQVYDVNSYALAAAARDAGAEVSRVGIVPGDPRRLREVVEGRLLLSEIVVVAGGVGGAGGDELRAALADLGDLDTTRVAMHPGSAQGFGRLGPDAVPTFLLPEQPDERAGRVRGVRPAADPDLAGQGATHTGGWSPRGCCRR